MTARDDLVMAHLWLPPRIAGAMAKRLPPWVELADLTQSGALGLIDAATRFEPGRGVPFRAYAALRIRGAIVDDLRRADVVPRYWRAQLRRGRESVWAWLTVPLEAAAEVPADAVDLDVPIWEAQARRLLAAWLARTTDARAVGIVRGVLAGVPQQDLARTWGCCPSRVSQVLARCVAEMRRPLEDA